MMISGKCTLFLESIATGEESHSSEFIASDLATVIDDLLNRGVAFAGALTDKTAANKRAWTILKEKYSSLYFHGCASHGLQLIFKDIFAATKSKRGRPAVVYPDGYPFDHLLEFASLH
jgi:Protein of unknown function (DUF 659)